MFFSLYVKARRRLRRGSGGRGAVRDEGPLSETKARPCGRSIPSSAARSTSNGRPKASPQQVRPASPPTAPTDSPWRIDAPPDSERLAPAAAMTLQCTPRASSGRFPGSSWIQMAYLGTRLRSPPLPSRHVVNPPPPPAASGNLDVIKPAFGTKTLGGAYVSCQTSLAGGRPARPYQHRINTVSTH